MRRLLLSTTGWLLVLVGLVLYPLPGPGLVVMVLGLALLMSAFAAAGLFVSSLTREPTIAAVGSFGLLLLVWLTANPFALLAIVLLAGMTVDIAVRALRRGATKALAWCAIGLWLGSLGVAAIGIAFGLV